MNLFSIILVFYFSFVQCEDLSEGADCVSEEGIKGKCVDIKTCMHVVQDTRDKKDPQICSCDDSKVIVCCTDCNLINDTQSVVVDRFGLHYIKNGKKAHDKCIDYVVDDQYNCKHRGGLKRFLDDERHCYKYAPTVVAVALGGKDANRGQYPHMALLGYGQDREAAQWLCGGSLISHRHILTAAHCLHTQALGKVKFIALGILKRTDPEHVWHHYNVKKAIPHPEYTAPSKYHDIAILKTDRRIEFSLHVWPGCLHTRDTDVFVAHATGWGAKGHRQGLTDTLQTVNLGAYTEAECLQFYPEQEKLLHGYNHTTQMCYGNHDDMNDTCEGDSGGPLQITSELSSCMHTIIGVVSFGQPCGFVGGSGVYTRVYHYVPWIESVVWACKSKE